MSTFYFNRSSGENINSQWTRYLQTQSYIGDIGEIISQNRRELQATLLSASAEHRQAFQQICGTLDDGFGEVIEHLQKINCHISELRGEISAMAAMLDWKLSLMIEEQRLTNELLGHIAHLLRIPDSQKQRVYHIEQGLKYFKNAIREGIDSAFYSDSLEGFKEAERIERKDCITLNRIGQIHLYSRQHMNIPLAEQYFLKSAREAFAEANVGGTSTASHFTPQGHQPLVYADSPFKAATAEAYLYAGRACYLQQKLPEAVEHAGNAYRLMPEFTEAGFEQAKYLAANNQEPEAAAVLQTVISKDRYFAIKTLSDPDLANKKSVLKLLGDLHAQAIAQATQEYGRIRDIITNDSEARGIVEEAAQHLAKNNFISGMRVLDLLSAEYQLEYSKYRQDSEIIRRQTVAPPQTLAEFIAKENQSAKDLETLREAVKKTIAMKRTLAFGAGGAAIGFVVGFFKGCTIPDASRGWPSEDLGTWFGTLVFCAVVGAVIGAVVGAMSEPTICN
jgi:hypothetical protein